MGQKTKNIEASIIRAMWVILGYSFVGLISISYGISLQYYNLEKKFSSIWDLISSAGNLYLVIILIIILYNLLFCHAYASLYIKSTDVDQKLYPKVGHWLETFLLIIVMVYYVPLMLNSNNIFNMFFIICSISLPWCICIIIYRTFLPYCNRFGLINHNRTKYKLIIPSFMLIANNIYMGASLYEMLNGQIQYYIVFFMLVIFIVLYCLVELVNHKVKDENSISVLDKIMPYFYYAALLFFGAVCLCENHYWNKSTFYIPMRTLFLACFVAVYLAMFEGWFLIRKEKNEIIEKRTYQILTLMPMAVFILFPFQQFQLLFWGLFIIGHLSAWVYWELYKRKKNEKVVEMAVVRGLLGGLTLFSLILDKWICIDVTDSIGKVLYVSRLIDISNSLGICEIAVGIIALAVQFVSKKDIKDVIFQNGRIIAYILIVIFLLIFYPAIVDIQEARILLAIIGCFIFVLFEISIKFFSSY